VCPFLHIKGDIMTTLLKTLTTLVLSTFLLTGCAIKQEDSLPMKTVKHTVNTPLYLGKAVETTIMVAVALPIVAVKSLVEETKKEKTEE
jgi:hypothetical protein